MAVFLFTSAISSALGEAFVCAYDSFAERHGIIMALTYKFLIALSIDPLLVWNYGSMGVICGISGIFFWLSVRKLDKQEDSLNNLKQGQFGEKN